MRTPIILNVLFLFSACNDMPKRQDTPSNVVFENQNKELKRNDSTGQNEEVGRNANSDFNNYWKTFRDAIIASDTLTIIKLTSFPLKCRGTFDDDPVHEINKDQFVKVFFLFLNQWNGISLEGETELQYIKRNVESDFQIYNNEIRIGNMVFNFRQNKWLLGFIYIEEEIISNVIK